MKKFYLLSAVVVVLIFADLLIAKSDMTIDTSGFQTEAIREIIPEGKTITIGFKLPWNSLESIKNLDNLGLVTTFGIRIPYKNIWAISKRKDGSPIYDWNAGQPIEEIRKIVSEGESVTIAHKLSENSVMTVKVKHNDEFGFVAENGTRIDYGDILEIFKGKQRYALNAYLSSTEKMKQIVSEGEILTVELKAPELVTTVKHKDDLGFDAQDGTRVSYEDIGWVTKKVPLLVAILRNPIKHTLRIILAPVVWGTLYLFSLFGYH